MAKRCSSLFGTQQVLANSSIFFLWWRKKAKLFSVDSSEKFAIMTRGKKGTRGLLEQNEKSRWNITFALCDLLRRTKVPKPLSGPDFQLGGVTPVSIGTGPFIWRSPKKMCLLQYTCFYSWSDSKIVLPIFMFLWLFIRYLKVKSGIHANNYVYD